MESGRSYEPVTAKDLEALGRLAEADRARFFVKRPGYRDRLLCSALCQGAAQHYVDLVSG